MWFSNEMSVCCFKLFQETNIVFREESEVFYLIFQIGNALYAHAKCVTLVFLRIDAVSFKHIRMHHSASKNLKPSRTFAHAASLSFAKREIAEQDIVWLDGLPVTKPERTLVDLCLDREDPSLIIDAYHDALERGLSTQRLKDLAEENSKTAKRRELMRPLLMVLND